MRKVFSSRITSWYWHTASFLSHLWQGLLPSHRTLEVRQLTHALIARRFRGRSVAVVRSIGNFGRKFKTGDPQKRAYRVFMDCGVGPSRSAGMGRCGDSRLGADVGNGDWRRDAISSEERPPFTTRLQPHAYPTKHVHAPRIEGEHAPATPQSSYFFCAQTDSVEHH